MKITAYQEKYKRQIIDLILNIQNGEAKINLPIEEQPDLLDIPDCYQKNGSEFWLAIEDRSVIGAVALMNYGGKKVGYALYTTLERFARENKIHTIVLDTPSVAKASHKFYERAGFKKIDKSTLPFEYEYPDRNSYLYLLKL